MNHYDATQQHKDHNAGTVSAYHEGLQSQGAALKPFSSGDYSSQPQPSPNPFEMPLDAMFGWLAEVAFRFDTPLVKVDTSVFNPARISRLPFTFNRKGESTEERPHRLAKVLTPGSLACVTETQLISLAQSLGSEDNPIEPPANGGSRVVWSTSFSKADTDWTCALDEEGIRRLLAVYKLQVFREFRDGATVRFQLAS